MPLINLYRQLIQILSSRGIPDEAFFELQEREMNKLNKAVQGTTAEVLEHVFAHVRGISFLPSSFSFLYLIIACLLFRGH